MSLRDDAIDALLQQKLWMEENWSKLEAACQSDEEKATLIGSYVRARDLWNDAETRNLVMNEAEISGLITQLAAVRTRLQDELATLEDIGNVLDKIAQGVEIGSKMVRLLG